MIALNAEIHRFEPCPVDQRTIAPPAPSPRMVAPLDAQQVLRRAAMTADADAAATAPLNVTLLWRELARGATTILDNFVTDERCYLVLAPRSGAPVTALEGRRLEILETVLGGLPQKNVAADLVLAPSTVALNARLGLERLGLRCKPSRAHPLLMLAARSGGESKLVLAACTTFTAPDRRELRVVSVPRPDQRLALVLPPAELSVIRALIEGLSYKEIAERRSTSTRTIANQITAVFRRLRVSGRNELVHRLFFEDSLSGAPPRANAETLAPPERTEPKPPVRVSRALRSA